MRSIVKHKIGEFSKMAKVTVKTLRYYDELGILKPVSVDRWNGYRFYASEQLNDLREIRTYCEAGLTLEEIGRIRSGEDPSGILSSRRTEFEGRIALIDGLMKRNDMTQYRAELRTLPGCTVAFRHGKIDRYDGLTDFVMGFADMCRKTNPDVECTEDDYCFVVYSDPEYHERDIELTYAQAVKKKGEASGEIGFRDLDAVSAVCVKHVGPYGKLGDAYAFATKWIAENGYTIAESPRECYIDGCWNKDSEDEYVTEIQIPVVSE